MSSHPVKVTVEYWFRDLQREIMAAVPSAHVEGATGRRTAFEVTVNGELVYSKLAEGAFPDFESVARYCNEVAEKGSSSSKIEPGKSGKCSIS